MKAGPFPAEPPRARIGVSACLLGEEVRYNGGHKRDAFLTEVLGRYVEWVPVCPEVEMGLGTPRPAKSYGKMSLMPDRTVVCNTSPLLYHGACHPRAWVTIAA